MMKTNIIMILMDDMGWTDLGCTGSSFYETPQIDALCRQGMRFTQAYASCPVCSPSRASLLSGRYPARLGVTDWIDMTGDYHPCRGKLVDAPYLKHLPADTLSVAQALKEGGYQTWHVGKWHLGGGEYYPERFGFDQNIGGCDWGHPHCGYFSPYHIHTLSEGPQGEYLTDRLTDEAIHLIENAGDQPFFLNLCHYAVHTPIQAKAQDVARFREKARTLGLDDQKAIVEGEWMPIWHKRNEHVQRRTLQSDPEYAAMIWNLDENIGRLVAALKDAGKLENTMLVFTSDNGGLSTSEGSPTCNAPASEGKGWLYEGGTRVPLFICWHGTVEAGSECDTPVTTPDFYPTFLEAAGLAARPEQHCDGVSLLPLLQGKSLAPRPIFWHYPHYGNQGGTPGSSVRLGDDKLIEFFEDGRLELYDLRKDLGESKDISAEQPEKTRELAALLHEWQIAVQAKLPAVNGDY